MDVRRLQDPALKPRRRATDRSAWLPVPEGGTVAGDRRLVRAAALGDRGAWGLLVDAHAQSVWERARDAVGSDAAAVEVCELVWLRLAQVLPNLDGDPVHVWLSRAVDAEVSTALARAAAGRRTGPTRRMA